MENTIATISTPIGKGAISIVRMSGSKALDIALKIFSSKNLTAENITPRYMYFGKIKLDNVFEECLMVFFKAPFSYTGENLIEFQVHGGILLTQKILEACLSNGAQLAEPGEFSKRAFLNGKITLDKAEAIIGEINAETEGELKNCLQITNGRLADQILKEQDQLKLLLAEIEVGMDYPDEVEELNLKLNIYERLKELKEQNSTILQNTNSAKYLKTGINVVLVGKTNVGKSSIMNALLGEDRAIVTDIKGTTRDVIVESFLYDGIKINLIDTAGIRETEDLVESIGIKRSKENLQKADLILFIVDGSEEESEEDQKILQLLADKKYITVINKSDKTRKLKKYNNEIEISATNGKNINLLKEIIVKEIVGNEISANSLVLNNERQSEILKKVQNLLDNILQAKNITLDILSMMIKQVWQELGKITGNTENEDIINLIFSKFCLGK